MATSYTDLLRLAQPAQGELSGTWGTVVNENITAMVEEAIAGMTTIDVWTADSHTLTTVNGTTDEARAAIIELTDTTVDLTGAGELIIPAKTKQYIIRNETNQNITVKTSGGTGVVLADTQVGLVYCDGTDTAGVSAGPATTDDAGIVELATVGETNTGTDDTRAVTPDGLDGWTGSAQVTTVGTISAGTWSGDVILEAKLENQSGTNTGNETQSSVNALAITTVGTVDTGTWSADVILEAKLENQSGTNTGDEDNAAVGTLGIIDIADQTEVDNGTDALKAVTPATLASFSGIQTVPDATESVKGKAMLATDAKVTTGTDDLTIVTPLKLENWNGSTNIASVGTITAGVWSGTTILEAKLENQSGTNTGDEAVASITVSGTSELATQVEVDGDTGGDRVVTSDTLNAFSGLGTSPPDASTTVKGIVELADSTETNTGTDDTLAVTPDGLDDWTGSTQLITLGTVTSGTWSAGIIPEAKLQNQSGTNTGDEEAAAEGTAGVAAIATTGEITTGSNDTKMVTPLKLEGWNGSSNITNLGTIGTGTWEGTDIGATYLPAASTTVVGIVELADVSQTNTGTSVILAVTPDGLNDWTGGAGAITKLGTVATGTWNADVIAAAKLPDASQSAQGVVEMADQTQADAGSLTSVAISPSTLANYAGLGGSFLSSNITANTTLTSASNYLQYCTPTTYGMTLTMPDATTMGDDGALKFEFTNDGSHDIRINDDGGAVLGFVRPKSSARAALIDGATTDGVWSFSGEGYVKFGLIASCIANMGSSSGTALDSGGAVEYDTGKWVFVLEEGTAGSDVYAVAWDSNTDTVGTSLLLNGTSSTNAITVSKVTTSQVLISEQLLRLVSISGVTLTLDDSAALSIIANDVYLDGATFVYYDYGWATRNGECRIRAVTVSGTTITTGTTYTFNNSGAWVYDLDKTGMGDRGSKIYKHGGGYVCVSFDNDSDACIEYATLSTITFTKQSAAQSGSAWADQQETQMLPLADGYWLMAMFYNSGNRVNLAVARYNAGTVTIEDTDITPTAAVSFSADIAYIRVTEDNKAYAFYMGNDIFGIVGIEFSGGVISTTAAWVTQSEFSSTSNNYILSMGSKGVLFASMLDTSGKGYIGHLGADGTVIKSSRYGRYFSNTSTFDMGSWVPVLNDDAGDTAAVQYSTYRKISGAKVGFTNPISDIVYDVGEVGGLTEIKFNQGIPNLTSRAGFNRYINGQGSEANGEISFALFEVAEK